MDKKSRIEIETFMEQYRPAVEAGMHREDFAKSIGVLTATVYQRVYELNRRDPSLQIPQLPVRRSKPVVDRARAAWKADTKPSPKTEPQPEPKPEPKPKADAKAKDTAAIVKAATKPKEPSVVNSDVMDELNKLLGS